MDNADIFRCVLTHLNSKDAKDDEESAADQDYVSDRFQGREEGLDDEFEAGGSVDHSERSEGADKTENAQDAEDFRWLAQNDDQEGVHKGDDD